ncbi:hypothetical protein AB834_04840 [PVC group bacterium (ex Bugula neritina AB1)]|nr:hypothetical protein AB834_04840 [PVC group bacterium (ex Bugula neritina AB1)]
MKIGLNFLALKPFIMNLERYCYFILEGLSRIDQKNEYIVFIPKADTYITSLKRDNISYVSCPVDYKKSWQFIVYEQKKLPKMLKEQEIDVLFSPANTSPFKKKCRQVTAIFDLYPFHQNRMPFDSQRIYSKRKLLDLAKKIDCTVTFSEGLKKDIVKFLNISSDKVHVAPLGKSPLFEFKKYLKDTTLINAIRKEYNIKKPYIILHNNMDTISNVKVVISAVARIKKDHQDLPFQVVCVGNWIRPWNSNKMLSYLIKKLKCEQDFVFISGVVDRIIAELLYHASLSINPHLYDHFSWTAFEPMYFDTPVIASDIPYFREVASDACLYVDPKSVEDMAKVVWELWNNEILRTKILRKGQRLLNFLNGEESLKVIHQSIVGG